MTPPRVLGIAVASGKAGYVFLVDGRLTDWGTSVKATSDAIEIAGFAQERINELRPQVLVTEKCDDTSRKGSGTKDLIRAVAETGSHNELLDISVRRPRTCPSKYEEAEHMVARHPDLIGYLPDRKRRIQDSEPRNMIVFEALALAEVVIYGPPSALAAAMG